MFIGIDLGTSSIKTILIDENQKTISSHTEKIKLLNPSEGFYEQDPKSWFNATIKCFNKIRLEKPKQFSAVKSLGISGQMHGATLIDKNNTILHPCILWNDTRAMNQCYFMEKKLKSLRKESGNIAMPGFTAPKILWVKENKPKIFKKIFKVLLPKDYLRFRLSQAYYTDMSDASGTLWLNVKKRKWSEKLLNLTDLSEDNMPSLVEGTDSTSIVEKKISNKIGFNNQVIIAGGAGDQAAGAIGSGVIYPNQSVISLGTSGVYFSPTNKFIPNTTQAVHSFCHCLPNVWHHMSVMLSATNCLDWICRIFQLDIDSAILKAQKYFKDNNINTNFVQTTPFFFPYLTGERTPYNNPNLRGSLHSLNPSTKIDEIIYSVIEGITFGIKDGFESVHNVSPKNGKIYLVGGGSKSDFWCNLLSSSLNSEILLGKDADLGPAFGAARLAMLASKNYNIKDVVKSMPIKKKYKPIQKLHNLLLLRYKLWKEISINNESISNNMVLK
tara:strand:- start:4122 stop:5618 length:1497 start_codon:yes stop_codon:yes gene_type:complete